MTSSDAPGPTRSRRGVFWLVAFLLVLFGLYSGGWFYLSGKVRDEAAQAIARLNGKGVNADCSNLQVSGYPLSFTVACDGVAYEDDARNVAATSGGLNVSASVTRPLRAVANLEGPLRTSVPGMLPLWLDWDKLHATANLWWPLPSRVTVQSEGLNGQTDPADDTDPVQLFSTARAQAELSPVGQDVAYQGSFADLEIDPGAIGGRTLPPLDGSGQATLKNGVALLKTNAKSLRGQSVDFQQLVLSSGEAKISLSGPVSVDGDGLIDADLAIKLENPKAISAILAAAIPEQAGKIEQGFAALAMLGNEQSMPLRIVKGRASLGFIPLGKIKPMQ